MAVVGAIASVASGAMGMMQANYQAKVAEMNARIAKDNAGIASERGGIEAQMQDVQAGQLQGEQISQQAASGVSLSGASQIKTRAMARTMAASDRMRIRENANYEAYGYRTQAANFKADARAAKISGVASLVGGILAGASELAGSTVQHPSPSLVGGSSAAAGSASTVKPANNNTPIPIPRPRPIMPSIGRPQNYINPLTRRKMGTY